MADRMCAARGYRGRSRVRQVADVRDRLPEHAQQVEVLAAVLPRGCGGE